MVVVAATVTMGGGCYDCGLCGVEEMRLRIKKKKKKINEVEKNVKPLMLVIL